MLMSKQELVKLRVYSTGEDLFGTQALSERRPRSNYTLLLWLLRHCMLVKPGERLQGMKIK